MGLVKLRKDDIEKIVLVGGAKCSSYTTVVANAPVKPDYIFNGGRFVENANLKNYGLSVADCIIDGEAIVMGNYKELLCSDSGFSWNVGPEIKLETSFNAKLNKANYFLGGSPTLIRNGEIVESEYLKTRDAKTKMPRAAMGVSDTHVVMYYDNKGCTTEQVANKLRSIGMGDAILLCGGTNINFRERNGRDYIRMDERDGKKACSTWICVYMKKRQFPMFMRPIEEGVKAYRKPSEESDIVEELGREVVIVDIQGKWAKYDKGYVLLEQMEEVLL